MMLCLQQPQLGQMDCIVTVFVSRLLQACTQPFGGISAHCAARVLSTLAMMLCLQQPECGQKFCIANKGLVSRLVSGTHTSLMEPCESIWAYCAARVFSTSAVMLCLQQPRLDEMLCIANKGFVSRLLQAHKQHLGSISAYCAARVLSTSAMMLCLQRPQFGQMYRIVCHA